MSKPNWNPTIEIEYHIEQSVEVELDLHRILSAIYELPLKRKWNILAGIINNLEPPLEPDENQNDEPLTDEQKQIIKDYLVKQLKRFES